MSEDYAADPNSTDSASASPPADAELVPVLVQSLSGRVLELNIARHDCIKDLKDRIAEHWSVPARYQRLCLGMSVPENHILVGELLSDDVPLEVTVVLNHPRLLLSQKPTRILWAEREESILVTLDIPALKDLWLQLSLDDTCLQLIGVIGDRHVEVRLELMHPVSQDGFKAYSNPRETRLYLRKRTVSPWRRLMKVKDHRVEVDWQNVVDSDDEHGQNEDFDQTGMVSIPPSL